MERGNEWMREIVVKFLCRSDFPMAPGGTNWGLIALCRVDNLVSIGTDTLRGVLTIGRRSSLNFRVVRDTVV